MKRKALILTMLVVIGISLVGCEQSPSLSDIINPPGCDVGCFDGLQVGVTTRAELEGWLREHSIDSEPREIFGGTVVYNWRFDDNHQFVDNSRNNSGVEVYFRLGEQPDEQAITSMIIGPVNLCVKTVVDALGEPIIVISSSLESASSVELSYPSQNVFFYVESDDYSRVVFIIFRLADLGLDAVTAWSEFEWIIEEECVDHFNS